MIGKTISHYKILEKLGAGGMGVVYKAHDTKLDRIVALKFLPQESTVSEEDQVRILQEARAASAVVHPNVCVIHDIQEHQGQPFIVMEYVEGKTLRSRVPIQNLQDAVACAVQIGEALEEAHGKGVIHRDIKTDNIMVNAKSQVKVMDFGLAKLKGSLKLTKTASTKGTLAYMAPEQIQGGEVDARSDIFSFGIVLYEMVTGHLPFQGEHEAAMMYSIVNEEPEPVQKYCPDLSSEMLHVINRALEKDPEDRYQNVRDMVIDLKRLKKETTRIVRPEAGGEGPGAGARGSVKRGSTKRIRWILAGILAVLAVLGWFLISPARKPVRPVQAVRDKSIAVLYFENRTDEKDIDKMLVDMLITNLGRNPDLYVVSGQRLYDILKSLGKQDIPVIDRTTATQVATQAGVKAMLLGSIWKVGSTMSVPAQMLDVQSGVVLNSDRLEIEAKPENILGLADRLTEKVNGWLDVSPEQPVRISEAMTGSYEAYRFYEKGRRSDDRFEFPEAMANYIQAIRLDSTFAMAYFRLAVIEGIFDVRNVLPSKDLTRARDSIAKAKKYGIHLPEKERKIIDAFHLWLHSDFPAVNARFKELAEEYPEEKSIVFWRSLSEHKFGQNDKAVRWLEKAVELDRSFANVYNILGYAYAGLHNYEKAFSTVKTYIALIPDAYNPYDSGAEIYVMAGRPDQALILLQEGYRRIPLESSFLTKQGLIHLLMNEPDQAREKFRHFAALEPEAFFYVNRRLSVSFLFEGRIKEAFALLFRDAQRLEEAKDQENELSARFDLARILLEQKNFEEALGELRKVEGLSKETRRGFFNPWPFMVDYFSGLCFIRNGEYRQAGNSASDLRTRIEESHEKQYSFLLNGLKAEIEISQGKAEEAGTLIEKDPFFQRLWFPRTRILQAQIDAKRLLRTEALNLIEETYNDIMLTGSMHGGDFFDFLLERSKLDYTKAKMLQDFGESAEAVRFYEKAIFNWRNADRDYVNLVDAETRLAGLKKKMGN